MNKGKIIRRLAVTVSAGAALLLSLGYWWQSNLVHELAGTAMFILVDRHIYLNRFGLVNLTRKPQDLRQWLVAILHLGLMANMFVLLATSVAVSQSLVAFLPIPDEQTIRDLHWFCAYWLVVTVGIHLGLHWQRVMALARSGLRLAGSDIVRTWILRSIAAALFAIGIWSSFIMDLGVKLSWNRSLNFWDFNSSVLPFFAHWGSVLALPAILTYYLFQLLPRSRRTVSTNIVR